MADKTIVEDINRVRWIRFDRPEKRNALRIEDVEMIRTAIREAPAGTACIVFTGENGHFAAGADVTSFSAASMGKLEIADESVGQKMMREVRTAQVPTIAAIEGYCVGLAMVISAMCDIRVVSRTAKFSMPELKIGIPVIGDSGIFAQYIGMARARELLLTGAFYSAEQLDSWGYINRLVDEGTAQQAVEEFTNIFRDLPVRTLQAQKRIFEAWYQMPPRDAHRLSILEYAATVAHPEVGEWIDQFKATRAAAKEAKK
ncbi:MAG TPA: enoyl-CoA hydratase/isomerase family protein [Sphingomonas sp.]|jgi:enoyl-CoA hydratase/carnithine racemase|nr:enoyl-CoA hydratase/isomerase family protein [Sphingomonas sp.]